MGWHKATNVIEAMRAMQRVDDRPDEREDHVHIPGPTRAGMRQSSEPYQVPQNTQHSRPDGRGENVSLSSQPGWSSPQQYPGNPNETVSSPVNYDPSRSYQAPAAPVRRESEYRQRGYAFQNNAQSAYSTQGTSVIQQDGLYHQQVASPNGYNYSQTSYFQDLNRCPSPGRYGDTQPEPESGMNAPGIYIAQPELTM
jgi:hypothetical protein